MKIESSLAQNIVISMKEIIEQEINFFNTDSIIIASTDESRIGSTHGGAEKVIATKCDLVVEYDGQYGGTRKGINVPIYAERQLIGAIGITGEKEEVEKYGKIIKKMTEILIKDAWIKDVSFKKRESYRILFEQLLAKSPSYEYINQLSNVLEIDLDIPRIAVVGIVQDIYKIDDEQSESLMDLIHQSLSYHSQHFFHINGSEIRLILDATINHKGIYNLLKSIIKRAKEELNLSIYLGIGNVCQDMTTIKNSYQQALTALYWGVINVTDQIEYFDNLDIGILLTNLPPEIKTHFTHKILGNLSKSELKEYSNIITIYGEKNGSIYQAAEELFIHNNTLQYKLKKIKKLTNYDPRELNDYVILSLAFKLLKMVEPQGESIVLKD